MVGIQQLTLVQFRNYIQKEFYFTNRIVGIVGPNGVGKTNVLDALYYLSFTKSYFSRPDAQNVHHAYQGLRIDGKYNINNNNVTITCIIRENLKKEFYFDEEMYPKHSQHLGKIPCVMIAPDDVQIITGSSEERRKLMDSLLSQMHSNYLKHLIKCNEFLGASIASIQNLSFYLWLVGEAREHIIAGDFISWKKSTLEVINRRL